MSRSSLILGVVAALVLHGLLFLPVTKHAQPEAAGEAPPNEGQGKEVTLAEPPRAPAPAEMPTPAPPKTPQPRKPAPELAKVVAAPPAPSERPRPDGSAGAETDDAHLPPLRILWSSPGQLRQVARELGMRIVAVDAAGKILAEVSTDGQAALRKFAGRLDQYSNRVRTLPADFFGRRLAGPSAAKATALWVLVPAGLDRQWIELQKRALARRGLAGSKVRELEGRFESAAGRATLVVTRVLDAES